ncbi:MAG: AAA family ATPase [Gammaproteobacteria bacterium]|nr:AAA family ATPase [Gammaproteobacteria bacterium]
MIITDLIAENILKYASLELNNLPEKGLIAIQGLNESGKSTIGETICFALFGRTFSLNSQELEKLIRWGETRCSATVRFQTGDGVHYEIARYFDRDGNQGARLNRVGEEDLPITRGVEFVDSALHGLLGYGYDEFIESFYLAQREITTPHPHSDAVKAMAGLTSMRMVSDEYQDEIETQQEAIEKIRHQLQTTEQELADLNIEPDRLHSLEQERAELGQSEAQIKDQADQIEQASTAYQDALPEIRAAESSRTWARSLRFLSLILAVALIGAWALIAHMPENEYVQGLTNFLSQQIPQWSDVHVPWMLYGGIGFVVLFLLFWTRVSSLNKRVTKLQQHSPVLAKKLMGLRSVASRNDSILGLDSMQTGGEAARLEAVSIEESTIEQPHRGDEESVADDRSTKERLRLDDQQMAILCRRIESSEAEPSEVRDAVGRELNWMRDRMNVLEQRMDALEQPIWEEKQRLKTAENLTLSQQSYEQNAGEYEHGIQLRELANDLLSGAIRQLSRRFNQELRDLVGHTLPLFTEGRYEHLQIDDDLNVRVFSSEKRDFMDLEEISSGTQRQIMLAVRLALSQELVNSNVEGRQFVFLDEPFAFFDEERTRKAIQVLPELSDDITQIWIVAQTFSEDQSFDVPIACSRGDDHVQAGS